MLGDFFFFLNLNRLIRRAGWLGWSGCWTSQPTSSSQAFFIFLYFLKSFFTEIYFRFHNLQVYIPAGR